MPRYRTKTPDLVGDVKDLQKRASKMERTPQLVSSAVNYGRVIFNGGDILIRRDTAELEGYIQLGSKYSIIDINDNEQVGMAIIVSRSNTVKTNDELFNGALSLKMTTIDGPTDDFRIPTYEVYDKSGNIMIADSYQARVGLSSPFLSSTWWDPNGFKTLTSGTFTAIAQTFWYPYHPHLAILVVVQNDAATTSEIRVVDLNSGNVMDLQTGPAASTQFILLTVDVLKTNYQMNTNWLEVQHRRASGAGTIRTFVAEMVGKDLS